MISAADSRLTHLQHEFPEWQPWLAVIETVVRESKDSRWQAYVPVRPNTASARIPILTGATISVDTNETLRWFEKLLRLSSSVVGAELIQLRRRDRNILRNRVLELLQASICQNGRQIEDLAL